MKDPSSMPHSSFAKQHSMSYWHKQGEKALFPDLLWARPEVKSAAGKLLIVGGHAQSFAAAAEAYASAERAGIGTVRVLLPDCLEKTVGRLFPAAEFAPSNPSGGFAMRALAEVLAAGQWADGVLLAGDLGRNSETYAMLENFASKYGGQLTITKDAADFFCTQPQSLLGRTLRHSERSEESSLLSDNPSQRSFASAQDDKNQTVLVLSLGQLQKLGKSLHLPYAFTSDLGLMQLVELLHDCTTAYPNLHILTRHHDHYVVAVKGNIATSAIPGEKPIWRVTAAASAATWWLQTPQNPLKP
ncbi:hypothetical protein IPL68_05500 [Candidatus Saccharibacteria bacterium]|nr:MAG: hypothetical protein IPL68_05500 [Candidatus Saccharibacteria bacterium]